MKCRIALLSLAVCMSTLGWGQQKDSISQTLDPVIVSGNKLSQLRSEAPIAISILSPKTIEAAKASRVDYLLNKVSGVYMPTIGGEQHMMSIRQPISLKGLYLYLEDGLPIRTSGLFSSNALIEINTSNIHSIEVIKGPASALYGAEAIGGVINILSEKPTLKKSSISSFINSTGLKKMEFKYLLPTPKGGWNINASWTDQKNGILEYSDFNKNALSIRKDFIFNKKLSGYQTLQYMHYYTQMIGSVDSIRFVNKDFSSLQSFTFRKIDLIRWRQNFEYAFNQHSKWLMNIMYRGNTMDQNPTYSIASTNIATKFKGQINSNRFDALVLDLQNQYTIQPIQAKFILGAYADLTKQKLQASFIDIYKNLSLNKYTSYTLKNPDSIITNYSTNIYNKALYGNFIGKIGNGLNYNASLRYDQFEYQYNNALTTGTPSSNNIFTNWSPKIGFTYNKQYAGAYLNYSQGFVPPQITEIYNAIRVPFLLPQSFVNYEIGGWLKLKKLQAEISIYQLNGTNEIISVRQPDGVNLNQNTGATTHYGIEYKFVYPMNELVELTLNATNAIHEYRNTILKGVDISGKQMSAAPSFWGNAQIQFNWSKNFNSSLEWQHQSSYFMDEINQTKYPGFDLVNFRTNYTIKKHSFWLHILNATNTYYSTMATRNFSVKGNAAYSYYIGEPRSIVIGWKYDLF
jgi:outer membrane cobalamin receptor